MGIKDVCCMHRSAGASVYYTNCAGDMPLENGQTIEYSEINSSGK